MSMGRQRQYRDSVKAGLLVMKTEAELNSLARRRRWRRKLRTALWAVVATAALFWGAVDLVGVPIENLLSVLQVVVIGVLATIILALLPAALLIYLRKKYRKDDATRSP